MDNHENTLFHTTEVRLFVVLAVIIFSLILISHVLSAKADRGSTSVPSEVVHIFPEVSLEAGSAYVYDVRTKTVIYAKNENTPMALASIAKIMSALVAVDEMPISSVVTVSGEALKVEGEHGLIRNERWSPSDLLDFSMVTSSNDGMRALALSISAFSRDNASSEEILDDFVREMNSKAREIGLEDTYFWNETGLDIPRGDGQSEMKGGAYGTARDANALMEYVLTHHPDLLRATTEVATVIRSLDNQSHLAKNTNIIVSEIPGLIASKTGFTEVAGGNLVIVFDPELGRPIIISLLGSTEHGRFEDMSTLISATMEYIVGQR